MSGKQTKYCVLLCVGNSTTNAQGCKSFVKHINLETDTSGTNVPEHISNTSRRKKHWHVTNPSAD